MKKDRNKKLTKRPPEYFWMSLENLGNQITNELNIEL